MQASPARSSSPPIATLGELLARARVARPAGVEAEAWATAVSGVAYDSRAVTPGALFVAVRGARHDGAAFAADACARGACAVLAESEPPAGLSAPWVRVPDARAALSAAAAALHRDPSHALRVVGATGTNGKTTTTYLLESILEHGGVRTGRISTVAHRTAAAGEERPAERTTPEAPDVQALLARMRDNGAGACVMEVSSHALALRRVDHVRFAAAVFTNLTRDHLDFHGDMEAYFAAKRRLFESLPSDAPAVINADDAYGRRLLTAVARPVTYAVDVEADVSVERLDVSRRGIVLDACTPAGRLHLRSPLLGRFNAYNVLAAVAAAVALDVPPRRIEAGVRALEAVPGRMEVVTGDADDVTVIVDFAHTDAALRGTLEAVRALAEGGLVTVFGCGGERQVSKRSLMGAVAARLSDRIVLTSDNPRSEAPRAIIEDIERGLPREGAPPWLAIVDREEAIARAVRDARPGDVVVIAGKGHERHQVIGSRRVAFRDVSVARTALARRRAAARAG